LPASLAALARRVVDIRVVVEIFVRAFGNLVRDTVGVFFARRADHAVHIDVLVILERRVAIGGGAFACAEAVGVAREFRFARFERVIVEFIVDIECVTLRARDIAATIR
jgi:hypothetical protein